eukprot:4304108-Pyramimonas_sp.AAC.1
MLLDGPRRRKNAHVRAMPSPMMPLLRELHVGVAVVAVHCGAPGRTLMQRGDGAEPVGQVEVARVRLAVVPSQQLDILVRADDRLGWS